MADGPQKAYPGAIFGRLTVKADSGKRKNGYIIWNCFCECGNEIEVDKRTLERGTITDCGCISRIRSCQRDITGQRFGLLTAEYCTGETGGNGSYIWHCLCDCGGEVDALLTQLISGYRKSCGCLSHPPLKDLIGKKFGRLTVTSYAGKKDGMHQWNCFCECGNEVIVGQTRLQSGKTRSCGCLQAECLKENMGYVAGTSAAILEAHMGKLNTNNTSGCTGVSWNRRAERWTAQIGFRGKRYYLGSYKNKEDAVKARRRGEEMYGDFLNWYYNDYIPAGKQTADENTAGNKRDITRRGRQSVNAAAV